jgi:glycosyltransferase involved in cell wall biosynthesis
MILPSRMEGFSLTLAEAMSCGRVPIATAVGDAGTVIQDGVNGFLAGSASEEAIGAALERAWSERARWRELGLAAAQFRPTEGGKSSGEILADSLIKLQR